MNKKTYGEPSFSYYAPRFWNSLPKEIRESSDLTNYKRNFKTLFQEHLIDQTFFFNLNVNYLYHNVFSINTKLLFHPINCKAL